MTNPEDTSNDQRCEAGNQSVNIPFDNSPYSYAVRGNARSDTKAVDGEGGATVSCSVVPDGSKYDVTGSVTYRTTDSTGATKSASAKVQILGIGPDDEAVSGIFGIGDSDWGDDNYETDSSIRSSSHCDFTVKSTGKGTTDASLGIAAGRIWGRADCSSLVQIHRPNVGCDAKQTYFIFENCDQ